MFKIHSAFLPIKLKLLVSDIHVRPKSAGDHVGFWSCPQRECAWRFLVLLFLRSFKNFLSFVVFHLRGGVLFGDGINGAEDDGLITKSKFGFLLSVQIRS